MPTAPMPPLSEREPHLEVEFVCWNPSYAGTPSRVAQDAAYRELRAMSGVYPYMQELDENDPQRSLSVLILDRAAEKATVREVQSVGKKHGLVVDLIRRVSRDYALRAERGDLPSMVYPSALDNAVTKGHSPAMATAKRRAAPKRKPAKRRASTRNPPKSASAKRTTWKVDTAKGGAYVVVQVKREKYTAGAIKKWPYVRIAVIPLTPPTRENGFVFERYTSHLGSNARVVDAILGSEPDTRSVAIQKRLANEAVERILRETPTRTTRIASRVSPRYKEDEVDTRHYSA